MQVCGQSGLSSLFINWFFSLFSFSFRQMTRIPAFPEQVVSSSFVIVTEACQCCILVLFRLSLSLTLDVKLPRLEHCHDYYLGALYLFLPLFLCVRVPVRSSSKWQDKIIFPKRECGAREH